MAIFSIFEPRMKWFFIDESITDGERRQGPYSIDDIREFVKQGKIVSETLVWHSGMENWVTWKEASETLEKQFFENNPDQEAMLENTIKALEQIIETNKQTRVFAGFFVRALAFITDNFILGLFGGIVLFVLAQAGVYDLETIQQAASTYIQDPMSPESMNKLMEAPGMSSLLSLWSIFQAIYFIVFNAIFSATPGKRLLHIHIETADGNKLTWGTSIARYLCSVLTQFTAVIYGLGYLMVCVDPKRRALHDWIARTFVVFDQNKKINVETEERKD